jgi:hypothetical protein
MVRPVFLLVELGGRHCRSGQGAHAFNRDAPRAADLGCLKIATGDESPYRALAQAEDVRCLPNADQEALVL